MSVEHLNVVKSLYENAVQSAAYKKWKKEASQAWRFYDGEQWEAEEVERLKENAQPAIVINKIAPKVDNVAGVEISGRTRVVYRSRSGDKNEEQTAKALSDLSLYVAENSDQAMEISNVFKAGIVTGIGWLDVGIDNSAEEGVSIFNRYEDEFQVVFDPNAKRMDYSDAKFVCRERWLSEDDIKMLFPNGYGSLIEELNRSKLNGSHIYANGSVDSVDYINEKNSLIRVVEVQYKKTEKQYIVTETSGKTFNTFDKNVAYANENNEVISRFAPRVYLAYFSDDVLLSHKPMGYLHNSFTLVPYIFKRHKQDGRPYGLVRSAIDPQREFNKRRSKAMHLLNTSQVIADIDAVEDPNILAREAARPDGVILKRPGKDLRIIRNSDLAASQVAVMEQSAKDIQDVLGVYDEAIGKHSNATSGTAIRSRQMASNLNQMFAFDALRRTKKQLGLTVLSLIRQFFTNEMVIQITDSLSSPRLVRLNTPAINGYGEKLLDENGEEILVNDVRLGTFDVHVEEVRDVLSSRELEVEELNSLIAAGVPVPHKMLVEATSLRKKEELLLALTPQEEQLMPTQQLQESE